MKSSIIPRDKAPSFPDLFEQFKQSIRGHEGGAIVSFTGIVREDPKASGTSKPKTTKIEIEAVEDLSASVLQNIAAEIQSQPGIIYVVIIHLTGTFNIGEPMVHVFVCAAHRQEAF
jgi:molybdopterin synthase catalytic subunit